MPDSWAKGRTVHQLIVGAVPGDAIADQAFMLRDWLREAGAKSEIYAERVHPALSKQVRSFTAIQADPAKDERLIFHYSIGSELSRFVRRMAGPIMMMYHNITPPEFFQGADPELVEQTERGRREIGSFANVSLAFANSEYSRRELVDAGYRRTAVLPLAVNRHHIDTPADPKVLQRFGDGRTNLLFVGRISPNKRQEDVIKAFAYYRRIDPTARLILVGGFFTASYRAWLEQFARGLGLTDVVMTGHVSNAELTAYYKVSRVFLCLSEHEGFGVPLLEAMAHGVPVLAFAAGAVPDTAGDAALLIHYKQYPTIAETIRVMVEDGPLRARLVELGRRRASTFEPAFVHTRFRGLIEPELI